MCKINVEEELNKIRTEILRRCGKGFTIEVNAEVTKYEIYRWITPLFGADTWKRYKTIKDTKYIRSFDRKTHTCYQPHSSSNYVDLDVSISTEVENTLPTGLKIEKNNSTILIDERELVRLIDGRCKHISAITKEDCIYQKQGWEARYIEGRRVYLTVTDEYANSVYQEVIKENVFLTKHQHLLEEIVRGTDEIFAHGTIDWHIGVNFSGIHTYGTIKSFMSSDGWDGERRYISFQDLGMKPLGTYEQLVEMTFAIIETMKNMYPEWEATPLKLEDGKIAMVDKQYNDGGQIHIHYKKQQAPDIPPVTPELKDW